MKKIILVVGIVPFLAACETVGPLLEDCERLGRAKSAYLDYGEEGIQILTKEVKRKSVFIIKLRPKKKADYGNKTVSIRGRSVEPPEMSLSHPIRLAPPPLPCASPANTVESIPVTWNATENGSSAASAAFAQDTAAARGWPR